MTDNTQDPMEAAYVAFHAARNEGQHTKQCLDASIQTHREATLAKHDAGGVVERLEDLHQQATEERTHYYVGKMCRESIALITALVAENDQQGKHIEGLQAALAACEQACWHEGQTLEGLNKAIRRAVQEFLDGKNPAQKLVAQAQAAEQRAEAAEAEGDMWISFLRDIITQYPLVHGEPVPAWIRNPQTALQKDNQ